MMNQGMRLRLGENNTLKKFPGCLIRTNFREEFNLKPCAYEDSSGKG